MKACSNLLCLDFHENEYVGNCVHYSWVPNTWNNTTFPIFVNTGKASNV